VDAEDRDFVEFAAARGGPLFRSAWLLTGDWHLSQDLVQETLGRMYRGWRGVSRIDDPAAYAHTVLVRTYLSHRRRRSNQERPSSGAVPDRPGSSTDEDATNLRLTLLDGLAHLDRIDRAVLVLRYWEDHDVQTTAELLQITPGAVRARCFRALRRLRLILGDDLLTLPAQHPHLTPPGTRGQR
jgi:RNA polymerase sigma-70 factor (sigma-E family)